MSFESTGSALPQFLLLCGTGYVIVRLVSSLLVKRTHSFVLLEEKMSRPELLRLDYAYYISFCVCCPIAGMAWCVMLSMLNHAETSTVTHCGAVNIIPSISTAIGDFKPQVYIWRVCITMMAHIYVVDSFAAHKYFRLCEQRQRVRLLFTSSTTSTPPTTPSSASSSSSSPLSKLGSSNGGYRSKRAWLSFTTLLQLHGATHIGELIGLLALTFVSSVDNKELHQMGFGLFVLCASVHMPVHMSLYTHVHSAKSLNARTAYSLWMKKLTMRMNYGILMVAAVLYVIHNTLCYDYVWSLFALTEYAYILTNIFFHATLLFDFGDMHFLLCAPSPSEEASAQTTSLLEKNKKKTRS